MKNTILFIFTVLYSHVLLPAQCTEAKDADMAKYKRLTETQDAQGCSQCAMLSLYFCSAKYCVKQEDVRKVDAMITQCKRNIKTMGQPYCCPELVNKEPQWGIAAGSSSSSSNSNTTSTSGTSSNNNSGTSGIILGNTGNDNSYNQASSTNNYNTGNDAADIANAAAGFIDILSGGSGYGGMGAGSGDAGDIINTTNNILQGLSDLAGGNTGGADLNNYNSYSSGGYNNNTEAANSVNQIVNALGGGGSYNTYDATGASDIISGVGSILSLLDEADAQSEQNRQAELQRQQQLEAIRQREENERRERLRIINNRKAVISNIPAAKIPQTYPATTGNEIYFFAYYTTTSSLESNNPEVNISNVFTVNKYSDGSWPLLPRLTEKVANNTKISAVQLCGYYANRLQAETGRNNLINQARSVGINATGIQYVDKGATASNKGNSGSSDFWETGYKKQNIPATNSNPVKDEKPAKPALDFWDNPVK